MVYFTEYIKHISYSKGNIMHSGQYNLEVMQIAVNYNKYLLRLVHSFLKNKDAVILDFGAGIGTFADFLSQEDYKILCVEPDQAMGDILKNKHLSVVQTLDDIENESVDYVYSFNVLEHAEEDSLIIKKLYSKLRSGGSILIYVPAFQTLYSSMDKKVGHFRRYTMGELEPKLKEAGFVVNKANYVDSLGFLATVLYKLIGNKRGDLNPTALTAYDKYVFPVSIIFDRLFKKSFGKNLYLLATKPDISQQFG